MREGVRRVDAIDFRRLQNNIRVDLYDEDTISKRIRNAEMQKIPYIAIIGDKEISADSVALRERGKGDTGQIKIQDFIDRLMHEANTKKWKW